MILVKLFFVKKNEFQIKMNFFKLIFPFLFFLLISTSCSYVEEQASQEETDNGVSKDSSKANTLTADITKEYYIDLTKYSFHRKNDDYSDFQPKVLGDTLLVAGFHVPTRRIYQFSIYKDEIEFKELPYSLPDSILITSDIQFFWNNNDQYGLYAVNNNWMGVFQNNGELHTLINTQLPPTFEGDNKLFHCNQSMILSSGSETQGNFKNGYYIFGTDYNIKCSFLNVKNDLYKQKFGVEWNANNHTYQRLSIRYPEIYHDTNNFYVPRFSLTYTGGNEICCSFPQSDSIHIYSKDSLISTHYAGISSSHHFNYFDYDDFFNIPIIIDYLKNEPAYDNVMYNTYDGKYYRKYKHRLIEDPNSIKKKSYEDIRVSLIVLNNEFRKEGEIHLPLDTNLYCFSKFAFCRDGFYTISDFDKNGTQSDIINIRLFKTTML